MDLNNDILVPFKRVIGWHDPEFLAIPHLERSVFCAGVPVGWNTCELRNLVVVLNPALFSYFTRLFMTGTTAPDMSYLRCRGFFTVVSSFPLCASLCKFWCHNARAHFYGERTV